MRAPATVARPVGTAGLGSLRDRLGICQWFHYQDRATLDASVRVLRELGVRHVRTGVSWADFYRPGGRDWYDRQADALAEFDVLLSVWHTPPSISADGTCSAPPKRLRDYADFIDLLITRYGDRLSALELWNEPNNRYKWNFPRHDPDWRLFAGMIGDAAYWARQCGVKTVLGGMIPVDHHWLNIIRDAGALQYVDVVAIHGFPNMWWPELPNWDWSRDWRGWRQKIDYIAAHAEGRPIWITETGLATWDLFARRPCRFDLQTEMLAEAAAAPAERVYWYSLIDLAPERAAIEGFHVDENEYHLGLLDAAGRPKPAFSQLREMLLTDR
jgi:CDP-paratose 2-epimerase